jgi:hypothetical protein
MTGDQSRLLRLLDRVYWASDHNDAGTVVEILWSGVIIGWDNGQRAAIKHNDMTRVGRVPRRPA